MNETGYTFSASDCCNGLGGGAYMQNNGSCVSCPRPQSKLYFVSEFFNLEVYNIVHHVDSIYCMEILA